VLVVSGGRLDGLVTDRDIAVRVLAENRDPLITLVGDICSRELAVLGPDDDVEYATRLVRERAVRRLPVIAGGTRSAWCPSAIWRRAEGTRLTQQFRTESSPAEQFLTEPCPAESCA
jgi:CBS domain-containing protein